jgi:hypothetical protein
MRHFDQPAAFSNWRTAWRIWGKEGALSVEVGRTGGRVVKERRGIGVGAR